MDDWLGRSGPLGAILGFATGGLLLLPVGYVYGQWVQRLPDAAGEAAYTAQVFPPIVSYFTGWMMLLAYFIVCPWEAVALKTCSVHFSVAEFVRIVPSGGGNRFSSAFAAGRGAYGVSCSGGLPGDPLARHFSGFGDGDRRSFLRGSPGP